MGRMPPRQQNEKWGSADRSCGSAGRPGASGRRVGLAGGGGIHYREVEGAAGSGLALEPDLAVELIDGGAGDGEAEAGAVGDLGMGADELLEDQGLHVLGDAEAVVGDADAPVGGLLALDGDAHPAVRLACGRVLDGVASPTAVCASPSNAT